MVHRHTGMVCDYKLTNSENCKKTFLCVYLRKNITLITGIFKETANPAADEGIVAPEISRTVYIQELEYIGVKGDSVQIGISWTPNPQKGPYSSMENKQMANLNALERIKKVYY